MLFLRSVSKSEVFSIESETSQKQPSLLSDKALIMLHSTTNHSFYSSCRKYTNARAVSIDFNTLNTN